MNLKQIATIAGTVTAIAGAAAVFGIKEFPRPAWASELKQLAGEVVTLKSSVTAQQLEAAKLSEYRNLSQQEAFKLEGKPVPQILVEEQIKLQSRVNELEDELENLRGAGN